MPDTNTKTGDIARNAEFRSLIENGRIENVRGQIDRSVKRNGGVIDQRSQRTCFYRNAANGRARRRFGRGRDAGVQNRVALEFAWISSDRCGCRCSGYRLCRGQAPNFRPQLGVLFLDLVEARHHVIEGCGSRCPAERDQAESSASCPRKKLIFHIGSPTFEADSTSERRKPKVYQMPIGRLTAALGCDIHQMSQKWYSDTTAMQQIVALMRNIDAPMGCEDRITWMHGALGRESEVGAGSLAPRC